MNFRCFLYITISFITTLPTLSLAATYYVDATRGNDTNKGTSPTTAFKTIAKINSAVLAPGDTVLFKRGETWREMLRIRSYGTESSPITYGAYGNAAAPKPSINGSDIIPASSWKLHSGRIYVAKVSIASSLAPSQLFVDGVPYGIARYPDSGYLKATSTAANMTSVIDSTNTLTQDQVANANVHARVHTWSLQKQLASGISNGVISVTAPFSSPMAAGYGYYLSNKLWMLNSPGKWVYDAASKSVYVWLTNNDSPTTHKVEISSRDQGIYGGSYAVIKDLSVSKANYANFYMLDSYNVQVRGTESTYSPYGFYFGLSTKNITLDNNIVRDTQAVGIHDSVATNFVVSNNVVSNSQGIGLNIGGSCATNSCSGIVIRNNKVTASGHNGITVAGINGVVEGNVVDTSCTTLDDCGAIYTGSGTLNNPYSYGIKIRDNTIINANGNIQGTPSLNPLGVGIYLDDFMYQAEVSNNTVSNANLGIYIHNGRNNTLTNNRIYGPGSRAAITISEDKLAPSGGTVLGNSISGNYISTTGTNAPVYFTSYWGSSVANFLSSSDSNTYCHPNSNAMLRTDQTSYTLPSWQKAAGHDKNSVASVSNCATTAAPSTIDVSLSASSVTVPLNGSTTLSWNSRASDICSASINKKILKTPWKGNLPASGSMLLEGIKTTATYYITCTGPGGSKTASATINVGKSLARAP